MIEVAAPVDFSSIAKAALLHHTTGCRIIHEEVTPNGTITLFPETIIYQQTQSLGTDATIPKRSSYPIACFHIVLAYADVTFAANVIADAAYYLVCGFQFDGPGVVVVEDSTDYLPAFFSAFVRRPAGTRAHLGVDGVFIQSLCVAFTPWTEYQTFCFHSKLCLHNAFVFSAKVLLFPEVFKSYTIFCLFIVHFLSVPLQKTFGYGIYL